MTCPLQRWRRYDQVRFIEKTTFNEIPHKFEAGTPNIVGGIGLAKAIEYIQQIGFDFIQEQGRKIEDCGDRNAQFY